MFQKEELMPEGFQKKKKKGVGERGERESWKEEGPTKEVNIWTGEKILKVLGKIHGLRAAWKLV